MVLDHITTSVAMGGEFEWPHLLVRYQQLLKG